MMKRRRKKHRPEEIPVENARRRRDVECWPRVGSHAADAGDQRGRTGSLAKAVGGMTCEEAKRLAQFEDENDRLERLDQDLQIRPVGPAAPHFG